jgi:hypothetical protein
MLVETLRENLKLIILLDFATYNSIFLVYFVFRRCQKIDVSNWRSDANSPQNIWAPPDSKLCQRGHDSQIEGRAWKVADDSRQLRAINGMGNRP